MFITPCMRNTRHVIQGLQMVFLPCPYQSENCHGTYVIPFDKAFTFSHILLHLRRGQDRSKHWHSGIPPPPDGWAGGVSLSSLPLPLPPFCLLELLLTWCSLLFQEPTCFIGRENASVASRDKRWAPDLHRQTMVFLKQTGKGWKIQKRWAR